MFLPALQRFRVAMEPRTALVAEDRQTGVDRVSAAGNCAGPMKNVPMAIADGARAAVAVAVNVRLVGEGSCSQRRNARRSS
jgi:thioredoxin reductase